MSLNRVVPSVNHSMKRGGSDPHAQTDNVVTQKGFQSAYVRVEIRQVP